MMDSVFIHTDPVKLRKFENDRKVAFMMAWHPRLGSDALIRRFVAKDVGKLIANHYLNVKSQLCKRSVMGVITKPRNDWAIGICDAWDLNSNRANNNNVKLIKIAFVDTSLTQHSDILIQTPLLHIPFVFDEPVNARNPPQEQIKAKFFATQVLRDEDKWFIDWITDIDVGIMKGLRLAHPSLQNRLEHEVREMYHPSFKRDETNRYPPILKIRIPTKGWETIKVFQNTNRALLGTLQQLWDQGHFGRGARIRVIMRHVGVWESYRMFTNQWAVEHVLLGKSAIDAERDQCLFDDLE
jgi:hypothetical protein